MKLDTRTVVITGATGGLGRVTTRIFAEQGARLALVGTDQGKLDTLQDELQLPDYRVLTHAADLSVPTGAGEVLKAVIDKFDHANVLLHFIGGWIGGKTVAEVHPDDLSVMLEQHLWTTFYTVQAFAPHFASNGWGRIAVISSKNVGGPSAKSSPYTVGKSAQEALIKVLAQEMEGTGVTANIVRVKAIDAKHRREGENGERYADWATPEEITAALLYLCSDEAALINGAQIPLFGTP